MQHYEQRQGQRSQPTQKRLAHEKLLAGSCDGGGNPSEDDHQRAYPGIVRSELDQIPTHLHSHPDPPQTGAQGAVDLEPNRI
ncbi:hypothetical protein L3X38_038057 [Prunus dulcis]|uniref:Uncharacterized protein n=1 Tax=Prunus dulcis TaxID=3755 RepID=A0AAD4V5Q4_PRUDU|nr:hypothetical protein L3X38_038057 [Prunus dulcis]